MKKIGFIGVGVMGTGMAMNLLKAGYEVTVFTRTRAKAEPVLDGGAAWADSIAACVQDKDAVITMVGYPRDVEDAYFLSEGILAQAKPGTYLIDMTTTRPDLALSIHKEAKEKGIYALDAPVSGGDVGAKNGTLSIMVGADEADYTACLPLFEAMGSAVHLQGPPGSGQYTKMANQIALCGALVGVCEAIAYSKGVGIDTEKMLESISRGAAGSRQMDLQAGKILQGDYSPGFYIKHFVKDLQIARESAAACGLALPVLDKVLEMVLALQRQGYGDEGTQALIRYYYGLET